MGRRCSCVTVTIRGNDFRNKSHQRKFPEPTDVTAEIFALSKTLFAELWDGYTPLRLLGVTLGDVSDNETVQLSMFQDDQKDRARKLDQTVDQLAQQVRRYRHLARERHGCDEARGAENIRRSWKRISQNNLSHS